MQYIITFGAIAFLIWMYGSTVIDIWRMIFKRKKKTTAPLKRLSDKARTEAF